MKKICTSFIIGSFLWSHMAVAAETPPAETSEDLPSEVVAEEAVTLEPSAFTETEEQTADVSTEANSEELSQEAKDAATLKRIEESLNAIQSLKTDFIQRAPDGSVAEGVLYLERPGKIRFDFGDAAPFLVVSDGSLLTFVDYDVKQVSRWPIRKTPLGILVDDEITFDSSVEVPDIIRFAGLVKVPVIDPKRQEYGYIILIFEESTMELRAWEVVDAQGYTTRVALLNPEYNIDIDKKKFKFKDPRPSRRGPRGR